MKNSFIKTIIISTCLLIIVIMISLMSGRLSVTSSQIITKIITGHEDSVDALIDLRMPRLIVALCAGAALSVAGAYLQAVFRNPLADASIIGVSSGALVSKALVLLLTPTLFYYIPFISFIGGMVPFLILVFLQYRYQLSSVRMILVGVAMYATLSGCLEYLSANPVMKISSGFALKVWKDAGLIALCTGIGLTLAVLLMGKANLLSFEDKQAHSIGYPIARYRVIIGMIAVFLASSTVAIAGPLAFVGLIVPHMVRRLVGHDYRKVIFATIVIGAFVVVLADTLGRLIFQQYEIPAHILTVVLGGPYLVYLICKGAYRDESTGY